MPMRNKGLMEPIGLEEQLELFNGSPVVVYTCNPSGDFAATFISRGISTQLGWEPREFLEDSGFWASHIHPDDRERVFAGLGKLFEDGDYSHEYRFQHKDGSYHWMRDVLRLDRDEAGNPLRIVGYWSDITEKHQAEQEVRESEAHYRTLVETMNEGLGVIDENGVITYVNDRACEMFGYSRDEMLGQKMDNLLLPDKAQHDNYVKQIHTRPAGGKEPYEIQYTRKDGTTIPTLMSPQPVFDSAGVFHGSFAVITDITESKKTEATLRETNRILELLFKYLPTSVVLLDRDFNFVRVNESYARECGRDASEFPGLNHFDLYPSDAEEIFKEVREKAEPFEIAARPFSFPDHPEWGETYWDWALVPILDESGEVELLLWSLKNVTEQKRLEDQFRQSQKMEAIGQLTGGVAHDFNNLLAVIQGNAQMLTQQVGRDHAMIQPILRATARGAELTQRLLAYSRRQSLRAAPVDMGALVTSMHDLLTRTLGETIEILVFAADDLLLAFADQGQVENALLNLAINARDAMPDGGRLIIECTNARLNEADVAENREAGEGDYVVLTVSDTGTGMSPEVMSQAFEPFYTTKEIGKGSGLGLSMIYGFAKQSGGHITIDSEVGRGTTVKLYLPKTEEEAPEAVDKTNQEIPRSAGETILIIEDDHDVRELAVTMLENLGYTVEAVADVVTARETLGRGGHPDLVLSDVILPGGINGPVFVAEMRAAHLDVRAVFMSGYAADTIDRIAQLGADAMLINKPFSLRELATAVRDALD